MTTAAEASWATSVSTPARASRRTRVPTPGGNRSIGRSRRPSRRAGKMTVATSASTPRVVPPDSRYSDVGGSSCSRLPNTYAPPIAPKAAYAPITTSDDSSGASAGP